MHPVPSPARPAPGTLDRGDVVDLTAVPIAIPDTACGLWVTAVDHAPGAVLEGVWLFDPDWSARHDEDVVATLGACHTHDPGRDGIHLEVYLVHDGRILRLGSWCALGADWPETLRWPAAAAMTLHGELQESGYSCGDRITT